MQSGSPFLEVGDVENNISDSRDLRYARIGVQTAYNPSGLSLSVFSSSLLISNGYSSSC